MLRGQGITSAATEHITRSVTEQRPCTILSVHKFSVLYSRAWRDRKTLMDTTHSAACQQCQHADESCQPRYSDKGVMVCEHCSRRKMHCSHVGGVVANIPTTDIMAWMVAVCDGTEIVANALNCQVQTFGALLDCQTQSIDALLGEVCGMRAAISWLSTSGVSSLQAAVSTVDADEDEDEDEDEEGKDMDGAVESNGTESGDDEDSKRVDIALTGTGANLGESAGEEEVEAEVEEEKDEEEEAEGSGPACTAEMEMFTPPAPSGCIRMPCPTTHAWKGTEVEKMHWE